MMNGHEKSDRGVVPEKAPNNGEGRPEPAEGLEGRRLTEGNADQQSTCRAQSRESVSQALERIRTVARERKGEKFTTLLPHISVEMLGEAFRQTRRDAAPGIDGLTWEEYETDLETRLIDLHDRVHRGKYRAMPARRKLIPKADGRMRPLAIAALEDKIVQRAVVMLLNAIYEEEFEGFSYGFRPGRGQHDALNALAAGINGRRVNWILDADIRSFFDTVDQQWLVRFLEHRISDRPLLHLIQKWLKVGYVEDGVAKASEMGTGQGAVISPLLANIYLHYAFDLWARHWRQHEARGDMIIVRYADDFVVGFEQKADADSFLEALHERLGKFGLTLHPEKTRLIEFGRFAAQNREKRGLGKPETFNFLGFTFICGKSRAGKFLLMRKSRRDRLRAKLKAVKEQLRKRMHQPIPETGKWLGQVVRGFFNYHAVPTNSEALATFRDQVIRQWRRTLQRRSQKDQMTWKRMRRLADDFLPKPRILHPWPSLPRPAVTYPR